MNRVRQLCFTIHILKSWLWLTPSINACVSNHYLYKLPPNLIFNCNNHIHFVGFPLLHCLSISLFAPSHLLPPLIYLCIHLIPLYVMWCCRFALVLLSSLHRLLFLLPLHSSPAAVSYLSFLSSAYLHSCRWVAAELAQLDTLAPQASRTTRLFHRRTSSCTAMDNKFEVNQSVGQSVNLAAMYLIGQSVCVCFSLNKNICQ